MSNRKLRVYIASSWFTPATKETLGYLESLLDSNSNLEVYSPRRDGIVLPPNQKHDTSLRESIFEENISNIITSDVVLANIWSKDPYNDPGTIYEIGYAMANNIPVVGFSLGGEENVSERFRGIRDGFECILTEFQEVVSYFAVYSKTHPVPDKSNRVLFVGCGNKEVDDLVASYILDSGAKIRWVNEFHNEIYSRIDEIFKNVEYLLVIIDDRRTINSWMIGQAYARGIPVVTYSNNNYGINVMLLVSILTHIRGTEELENFLAQVREYGLSSIPKFDISQMDSM